MSLIAEGRRLAFEVSKLTSGRGRSYPAELKQRLMTWAESAERAGMSLPQIGTALGMPQHRFQYWREREQQPEVGAEPKAIVPVDVVADPPMPAFDEVTVVSPTGFRIEGLTMAQTIELMRALG
jgi:hypothetical protein